MGENRGLLDRAAKMWILMKTLKWVERGYGAKYYRSFLNLTEIVARIARERRVLMKDAWRQVRDRAAEIVARKVFGVDSIMEAFESVCGEPEGE